MADRRMFRYEVPIDDAGHVIELDHNPVAFAAGIDYEARQHYFEFWAEHTEGAGCFKRTFRVVGTGHLLPEDARYVGTAPRTQLGLVWHLYEIGWGQP